jgi:hypothetical protein
MPLPASASVYLVGGAVRDRLLGLPVGDRDFVVVGATPEDMRAAGFRPIGADFPVFLHPETGEEYALARTERKSGRGYKGFVFHAAPDVTLEQDLARRDLTINAIAEDSEGRLVDPFGGARDLGARVLRHVSPAFVEDPLRVLRVARFASRRELRGAMPALLELYNSALGRSEGNVPFTQAEAKAMASQILWFADPRLIKLVYKSGKPVGFLLAYPDISEAVRRVHGRLWPLGWFRLWRALKTTTWVNVNGMGILAEHRGGGGTALLFSEMRRSIVEGGFEHADLVQIGVENMEMQREMRGLGISFYKTHRMYARSLGQL